MRALMTIVNDFGGIVVFYALMYTVGLKAAIAGSLVFVLADIARRRWAGIGFPRIYVLSSGLAIGFGLIDLILQTPIMLKFEAPITNAALGAVFVAGARGKSMIEEMAAQRDASVEITDEVRRFFQLLTLIWAGFFLVRAAIYVGIAFAVQDTARAITVRSIFGYASLGLMVLAMTQGRRLFFLFRRLGLLPRPADAAPVAAVEA